MVTRALYRGSAHVCVEVDDEFARQVGDFAGIPVRERFPELAGLDVFEAMDAVFLSGQPIEMPSWPSVFDGEVGTLLIRPWRVDGEVLGVFVHHYPYAELIHPFPSVPVRHSALVTTVLAAVALAR